MLKKLKIAQIAPLWIPVPPITYGGTEFMIHLLSEELLKRGHEVTLFASGDSQFSGTLVAFCEKSLWRLRSQSPHAYYSMLFSEVVKRQNEFDIIHDHSEFYFAPFSAFIKKPIMMTLHRPITRETAEVFKKFPNINYIPISHDQRESNPEINFSKTIHHGIPVEQYAFKPDHDNYLVWLSKLIPEKGILEAIEVAKRSGEKLIICGNIAPGHELFFKHEIVPLIDGEQIRYVGEANFEKKIEILSRAKALLYPISRREPFGLVIAEAMACGTPVIAFGQGAVPEVVADGRTGFVVKDVLSMIGKIQHIGEIDRKECRRHIEENFNLKKMVDAYESLYCNMAAKR